jgi:hypothetical protein
MADLLYAGYDCHAVTRKPTRLKDVHGNGLVGIYGFANQPSFTSTDIGEQISPDSVPVWTAVQQFDTAADYADYDHATDGAVPRGVQDWTTCYYPANQSLINWGLDDPDLQEHLLQPEWLTNQWMLPEGPKSLAKVWYSWDLEMLKAVIAKIHKPVSQEGRREAHMRTNAKHLDAQCDIEPWLMAWGHRPIELDPVYTEEPVSRVHGDLTLSNILSSGEQIYLIDPNAHVGYAKRDLAKLWYSWDLELLKAAAFRGQIVPDNWALLTERPKWLTVPTHLELAHIWLSAAGYFWRHPLLSIGCYLRGKEYTYLKQDHEQHKHS